MSSKLVSNVPSLSPEGRSIFVTTLRAVERAVAPFSHSCHCGIAGHLTQSFAYRFSVQVLLQF